MTTKQTAMEVDTAFLKSRRGIVKVTEMVTLFVAFVCFAVASTPKYIAATALEFFITSLLLVLYLLKLNKRLTFFFWPLVDVLNSVFASVYFITLSLMAMTSYINTGMLIGGIMCFLLAVLLCAESYILFSIITFNRPRTETQNT
ncbi:chemokine-like factor [Maylandia zebra]|uniref:Chemokine-like factor n=2 Tax=Haplochromini TaxID=319058 RepID=A0A9Y3QZI9_9CICH|nr:PREDICTED: chemokine-like factor [Pundamilia nyererei]XP_005937238.1 chemokine-like factor [Haplochromis burtoni]XP_013763950.1 PREDICTED: chemokine-like factor [Pundamilia nyererei]XP_026021865.1 chemokine-like factor [Astatotilapia calliptera]XP_026021875.1 chemokine-like factor [Astatotilapia calliptera]XP_026021884.1 chemokine-like factor [Astatotilapia calliptera]XP_039866715.1 chemokine-like factor [Simochromis diagramma]XP_039866716.1 chemokine-like factor [Simochromis diagramma]